VDIASKVAYGSKFPANLNGTDFIPGLLQHMKRPLKVALLGGGPGVAADAAELFKQQIPHHEYRVISDGFFKPADLDGILAQLKDFHPDILLVAMGVPRQELFIDSIINGRALHGGERGRRAVRPAYGARAARTCNGCVKSRWNGHTGCCRNRDGSQSAI
jgi:exopolysaccharide biosynthesis WecB/TagA/CpsF family protein